MLPEKNTQGIALQAVWSNMKGKDGDREEERERGGRGRREEREERGDRGERRECEALRAAARLRLQKQAATPKSLMSVGSFLRRLRSVRVRFPRHPRIINNKQK